jgi:hypothetical protein
VSPEVDNIYQLLAKEITYRIIPSQASLSTVIYISVGTHSVFYTLDAAFFMMGERKPDQTTTLSFTQPFWPIIYSFSLRFLSKLESTPIGSPWCQ